MKRMVAAPSRYIQKNAVVPEIIQGVETDYTTLDHSVGRLQTGGWKYIKIESLTKIQELVFSNTRLLQSGS